jgi:excisionase family DNA binding protein
MERTLTPPEVAKLLRVATRKVRRWIRSGELKGINVADPHSRRPRFRVTLEALERFQMGRTVEPPTKRGRPRKRRMVPTEYIK